MIVLLLPFSRGDNPQKKAYPVRVVETDSLSFGWLWLNRVLFGVVDDRSSNA